MKQLLLLFTIIISFKSFSQTPILYTNVVHVDSTANQYELYLRARNWFAETFNNSSAVLKISDKESGELVGRALFNYYSSYFAGSAATKGSIEYTIKIWVKDGRYKYEITDFIHKANPFNEHPLSAGLITTDSTKHIGLMGARYNNKVWKEMQDLCAKNANALITSLSESMMKPSKGNNENW